MIENIVLNYLKADTTLATLTGKTANTPCNIYPDVGQVKSLPCVVMSADSPTSPINEPYYYVQNLTFEIYASTEKSAQQIRDRFYELLNKYDDINLVAISKGIIIKEAHAVFASVSNHFPNETIQAKEKVVSFDFQYTKCA